jgi:hypothetical protein
MRIFVPVLTAVLIASGSARPARAAGRYPWTHTFDAQVTVGAATVTSMVTFESIG